MRVPQVAVWRRFEEFELPDQQRGEPSAFLHFLRGQPLAPSARPLAPENNFSGSLTASRPRVAMEIGRAHV